MKRLVVLVSVAALAITAIIIILYTNKEKRPVPRARVAFIIDDWGYNKKNIDALFGINRPVTVAILPNVRYSREIAEKVRKKDKIYDAILHLPLESKSDKAAEMNTIRCDMPRDEILSLLERDIKSIPGIIGVSNHQGSKATENKKVMKIILSELKKRKLFFVDSLTTPDSICSEVAGKIGLKYAERDVFLDLTDQTDQKHFEAYIKGQIEELAETALLDKTAIGIGHDKSATLKVIKDSIPDLEKRGIKIVPLKELVE